MLDLGHFAFIVMLLCYVLVRPRPTAQLEHLARSRPGRAGLSREGGVRLMALGVRRNLVG